MLQNPGILENHKCLFYVENAIEMRKERNGDEYKEIRRASCSIEKPQNG